MDKRLYLRQLYWSVFYHQRVHSNAKLILCQLFLLFIVINISSLLASSEINLTRSKLIQLAAHLESAEAELKYEFSRIALIELYSAYQNELNQSFRNLPADPKKRAKIRRWGHASNSYLESLEHYFYQLDSGKTPGFYISKQNKIILLIAGQAVIISGPNSGANKQIEKNIVEQFCLLYDCTHYFINPRLQSKNRKEASVTKKKQRIIYDEISGLWSIKNTLSADYVTTNGIVFKFSSIKNRIHKETWALGVSNECAVLIDTLKLVQLKGNKIHWSSLKIEELPVTDKAYKITINREGDYLKLPLPLLGSSQILFAQIAPWLKRHFDNKKNSRIIIYKADQFISN